MSVMSSIAGCCCGGYVCFYCRGTETARFEVTIPRPTPVSTCCPSIVETPDWWADFISGTYILQQSGNCYWQYNSECFELSTGESFKLQVELNLWLPSSSLTAFNLTVGLFRCDVDPDSFPACRNFPIIAIDTLFNWSSIPETANPNYYDVDCGITRTLYADLSDTSQVGELYCNLDEAVTLFEYSPSVTVIPL